MVNVVQRPRPSRTRRAGPDRTPTGDWDSGYVEPTDVAPGMFSRSPGRSNRTDDGMDGNGLALLLQQQTQIASDLAAMRVDVAKMAVQVTAIPDMETRLRTIEQRPSTTDLEGRVRLLERWRYALPVSAVLGIGSAVGSVVALLHH